MACAPAVSNDVAQEAVPAAATAWTADPAIGTPPSKNAAVPVGVPEPGAVTFTIAVTVSGCPATDGFSDDASDVVVAAGLTVCVSMEAAAPMKFLSPLYTVVIASPPATNALTHVAMPAPITGSAAHPVMLAPLSS